MTVFDENERRAWAGRAEAYANSFAKLCAHPVQALLDAARVGPGTRVLDVGTGTGTVAAAACGRRAVVTAVDAEPGMVEPAARNVPEADVRVAVLPGLPFEGNRFDAVVGNFVLNHVGQPRVALAELDRVARPGGWIALTVWATPNAAGQALLARAVQAAGVSRPAHLPPLAPEDDFPRTERGFTDLLLDAGLTHVSCESLTWDHRTDPDEWWSGPASGVATIGQIIVNQQPGTIARTRRHFDVLAAEFTAPDGLLVLPHRALLACGRATWTDGGRAGAGRR